MGGEGFLLSFLLVHSPCVSFYGGGLRPGNPTSSLGVKRLPPLPEKVTRSQLSEVLVSGQRRDCAWGDGDVRKACQALRAPAGPGLLRLDCCLPPAPAPFNQRCCAGPSACPSELIRWWPLDPWGASRQDRGVNPAPWVGSACAVGFFFFWRGAPESRLPRSQSLLANPGGGAFPSTAEWCACQSSPGR